MFLLLAIWRIGDRSSNFQINVFDEDIVKIPDTGKKPRPIWPGGKIFCLDRSNMGFWFALARIIRGIKRTPISADWPKCPFGLERSVNASIDPVPAGFAAEKERPSKPGHRQNQNDGSECDKKKTKYFHKLWDVLAERAQATITRNSMEPEQRRQRRLVRSTANWTFRELSPIAIRRMSAIACWSGSVWNQVLFAVCTAPEGDLEGALLNRSSDFFT